LQRERWGRHYLHLSSAGIYSRDKLRNRMLRA
jgi:hypothetical protein